MYNKGTHTHTSLFTVSDMPGDNSFHSKVEQVKYSLKVSVARQHTYEGYLARQQTYILQVFETKLNECHPIMYVPIVCSTIASPHFFRHQQLLFLETPIIQPTLVGTSLPRSFTTSSLLTCFSLAQLSKVCLADPSLIRNLLQFGKSLSSLGKCHELFLADGSFLLIISGCSYSYVVKSLQASIVNSYV